VLRELAYEDGDVESAGTLLRSQGCAGSLRCTAG
jgi:hypothetical protein